MPTNTTILVVNFYPIFPSMRDMHPVCTFTWGNNFKWFLVYKKMWSTIIACMAFLSFVFHLMNHSVTKAVCQCATWRIITFLFLGPGSCGYPDCPKPCYVDHTTGMVHMFCGQTHATQYKELQTSGTVHDTTHKRTVVTRHASRSEQFVIWNIVMIILFP